MKKETEDWVKLGSGLEDVRGLEGVLPRGLDCLRTLARPHMQLIILIVNIVMKTRTKTELIADCHGGTETKLMTAQGFYSMLGSLDLLLNLKKKHEIIKAISVHVFAGVLQTEQKHVGKWREAIEVEMNIRQKETYRMPSGARYLVGSRSASMCKSRYPVHFAAVDVKSTRTIRDLAFSVPICVRIARISEKFCRMFAAVPERTKEKLGSLEKISWDMLVGSLEILNDRSRKDQQQ